MQDVAFLGLIAVFFAVAAVFVAGCDRIIGTDDEAGERAGSPSDLRDAA
jgi:hypothetical protein